MNKQCFELGIEDSSYDRVLRLTLKIRAEMYPATHPHSTYKRTIAVNVCPFFIGLINPNMEHIMVRKNAQPICAPVPTSILKIMGWLDGDRKTSP